jgi:hypothetical protein
VAELRALAALVAHLVEALEDRDLAYAVEVARELDLLVNGILERGIVTT